MGVTVKKFPFFLTLPPICSIHEMVASMSRDILSIVRIVSLSESAAQISALWASDFDEMARIVPDSVFGKILTFILFFHSL